MVTRTDCLSDLGSRWRNRFATTRAAESAVVLTGFSPKKFLAGLIRRASTSTSRSMCECFRPTPSSPKKCPVVTDAPKKVLWTPPPMVTKKVRSPDRRVNANTMLTRDLSTVNAQRLNDSQAKYAGKWPPGPKLVSGKKGWRVNQEGVPDQDKELQRLLYVAAHQGLSGHRGLKTMLNQLEDQVFCPA